MKRFWKVAEAERESDGWRVLLDGRGVKTVGGKPQIVPTEALAKAQALRGQAAQHVEDAHAARAAAMEAKNRAAAEVKNRQARVRNARQAMRAALMDAAA